MTHYGPERHYDEKTEQLQDWLDAYNLNDCGIMGITQEMITDECWSFILGEFARFNIPVTKEIMPALEMGVMGAMHVIDAIEPYSLFYQVTDVTITNHWCQFTYEIRDDDGRVFEANPESLETFSLAPGMSIGFVNYARSHPGLKAFPSGFGYTIESYLRGDITGEDALDILDATVYLELVKLCREPNGDINKEKMYGYLFIAAWAAVVWLASPDAESLRTSLHDIFAAVHEFGECILYEGVVMDPTRYRKIERLPGTCIKCGVNAWCAEHTFEGGEMHYICESCLYGSLNIAGADCGTKRCKYVGCPNHPAHSTSPDAQYLYFKQRGQLAANVDHARQLIAQTQPLRRLRG